MQCHRILELLGRASTDPAVLAMLDSHGLSWRPALDPDKPEIFTDWFPIAAQGVEFGFQDQAYLEADEPALRRRVPLIFHEVIFYGEHVGMRPYVGDLPLGLAFSDDRAAVRQRLAHTAWPRRFYTRDVWELPEFRLIVSYAADDSTVTDVICCLREKPWPPREEAQPPHPAIAVIAGLLGQSVDAPAFRQAFLALGVVYELARLGTDAKIDMRLEYGFDIHAGISPTDPDGAPRPKLFEAITFYRDRDMDARAWAADLPFGIRFDDSPSEAVARVKSRPAVRKDRLLSGTALWHLAGCSLHLTYSTLDNLVYRVSLWRKGALPAD